jgi:hypothetical protein
MVQGQKCVKGMRLTAQEFVQLLRITHADPYQSVSYSLCEKWSNRLHRALLESELVLIVTGEKRKFTPYHCNMSVRYNVTYRERVTSFWRTLLQMDRRIVTEKNKQYPTSTTINGGKETVRGTTNAEMRDRWWCTVTGLLHQIHWFLYDELLLLRMCSPQITLSFQRLHFKQMNRTLRTVLQ